MTRKVKNIDKENRKKETRENSGNKKKGLLQRKSSPSEKKSCSDYTVKTRKMKKGEDCYRSSTLMPLMSCYINFQMSQPKLLATFEHF